MKFDNYDLCLITDEKERLYFTGFSSTDGYLILTKEKKVFVIDSRYFYAAEKILAKKGFEVICGSDFSVLKNEVDKIGAKTIGIDFSVTTLNDFNYLKKLLSDCDFCNIESELQKIAAIKSGEELKNIEIACKIAEESFFETIKNLKVGMTEKEVAAELEYHFKMHGATNPSFDTIVGFNQNSAVPHHETGDDKLTENSIILIDFGCIYNGYCSDMTRTFFFGKDKPSDEFLKAYDAVYRAHMLCYDKIKVGMTGGEADKVARDVLDDYGLAKYFTHSLGHGIGVHIHEFPWVAPNKENILENNMVFSNEPGVYFDGKFGIRIEDSTYLADGKLKTFMKDDKKLIIVYDGKVEKYKG